MSEKTSTEEDTPMSLKELKWQNKLQKKKHRKAKTPIKYKTFSKVSKRKRKEERKANVKMNYRLRFGSQDEFLDIVMPEETEEGEAVENGITRNGLLSRLFWWR